MWFRACLSFLAGVVALVAIHVTSATFLGDRAFDFGRSLYLLPRGFSSFLLIYTLLGCLAAAAFLRALHEVLHRPAGRAALVARWNAGSDRRWLVYGAVLAAVLPALVRTYLLQGLPLTDDESAYRFMARLLAEGRLWADSPPLKLAFDNRFMVNDGRMYAQYFLGWPALLVPGVFLGITGFMNCFYAALTVPPLYLLVQRLAGTAWARISLVVFLASPMLMTLAATELAHTACLCALAWFTWCTWRAVEPGSDIRWHAAAALTFCIAFWIRPLSSVGIGLPWLLFWAYRTLRDRRWQALAAFAVPAASLAALFLVVNHLQNGSPLVVAYERYLEYSRTNGFRFSLWPAEPTAESKEMAWLGPGRSLAMATAGFLRLNFTLFGWPCSLLFAFFAGRSPAAKLLWGSVLSYFLLHLAVGNVGIDAFAPMHYIEVAWPILVLTPLGLRRLTLAARDLPSGRFAALPVALLLSLVVVAWSAYTPMRWTAIARMIDNISLPFRAAELIEDERAIIFTQEAFVPYCAHKLTRGWVHVRPNNRPDLSDRVLWVNHLTVEIDRAVSRWLDRPGYVIGWTENCQPGLVPLSGLGPGEMPDAEIEGLDEVVIPTELRAGDKI